MSRRFEVDYTVTFLDRRCFCGAGFGWGGVDQTFARDAAGRMFVPGSHVKGVVRDHCEALLAGLGVSSPDPHDPEQAAASDALVTRLFGKPGARNMTCVFSDLRRAGGTGQQSETRQQVKMNRKLGRPEHAHLFNTEYALVEADAPLEGNVTVWLEARDPIPVELTILCSGLRLVNVIGGDKSSGAGSVRVDIRRIVTAAGELDWKAVLGPLGDPRWPAAGNGGAA